MGTQIFRRVWFKNSSPNLENSLKIAYSFYFRMIIYLYTYIMHDIIMLFMQNWKLFLTICESSTGESHSMEGSRKAYVYKAKGSQCPVQNTALRGDFILYTPMGNRWKMRIMKVSYRKKQYWFVFERLLVNKSQSLATSKVVIQPQWLVFPSFVCLSQCASGARLSDVSLSSPVMLATLIPSYFDEIVEELSLLIFWSAKTPTKQLKLVLVPHINRDSIVLDLESCNCSSYLCRQRHWKMDRCRFSRPDATNFDHETQIFMVYGYLEDPLM